MLWIQSGCNADELDCLQTNQRAKLNADTCREPLPTKPTESSVGYFFDPRDVSFLIIKRSPFFSHCFTLQTEIYVRISTQIRKIVLREIFQLPTILTSWSSSWNSLEQMNRMVFINQPESHSSGISDYRARLQRVQGTPQNTYSVCQVLGIKYCMVPINSSCIAPGANVPVTATVAPSSYS